MRIKEIYPSIQGEGSKSGKQTIFVRFAGCNLWSGIESLRFKGTGHCALWCDTDFVKGEKYSEESLLFTLINLTKDWHTRMVVFTGGEPCLQLKKKPAENVVKTLLNSGWIVSVETNGTIDSSKCNALNIIHNHSNGHITLSPKPLMANDGDTSHIHLRFGTDMKVIIPTSFDLGEFKKWNFEHFFVQPMDCQDGLSGKNNLSECMQLSTQYGYDLSIQTHKFLGLK